MNFPRRYFSVLIAFAITCFILRLITPGFVLQVFWWIIIPFYILHFFGLVAIQKIGLNKIDTWLIYISTTLLLILAITQYDSDDSGDWIGIGAFFLPNHDNKALDSAIIICAIADSIISTYFIALYFLKRKVNKRTE